LVDEGIEIVLTLSTDSSTCGDPNGSATILATGGAGNFSFNWLPQPPSISSTGTSTSSASLEAGAYMVTATDMNGCTEVTYPLINDVAGPTAVIYDKFDAVCFGTATGSASVGVIGGTGPYDFLWSTIPPQTTPTAVNLPAGVYTVTVTDNNGCVGATITDPEIEQPPQMQIAFAKTNVSCNGGSDGSATVTVSGGTPNAGLNPYTYSWLPFGGTSATATGLSAGTYHVIIKDANDCDTTIFIVISEPTPLIVSGSVVSQVNCFGGADGVGNVAATGGSPGYFYSWYTTGPTSSTATGLPAGSYNVIVTDIKGCQDSVIVAITEPNSALTATVSTTPVSCFNGFDGAANALVLGGTSPYSYSWASGSITQAANNLYAGNYTVTITDFNGCTTQGSGTVTQPNPLSVVTAAVTPVSCHGGSDGTASLSVSGGTPAYTYSWPNNANTAAVNGLSAGAHNVAVSDSRGCSTSIVVFITEPFSPVSVSVLSTTEVSCFGGANGSASVSGSGGTAPYSFNWNPVVSFSNTAVNLSAGSYTVMVVDNNNCTASTIVNINEPSQALSVSLAPTHITCNGANNGQIAATGQGGTPGYSFSWSHSSSTNALQNNLAPGTYLAFIQDSKGCQASESVSITQPTLIQISTTKQDVSCFGGSSGSAAAIATGGTGTIGFTWSPGPFSGSPYTGLSVGIYSVTATDANGCQVSSSVTINQPSALSALASKTDVLCNGQANGFATVQASGGTGAYSYSWNPPVGSGATINNLIAGTYNITVVDALGCTIATSATVNEPAILTSTITSTPVSCKGGVNGTASVNPTGGNGSYSFNWSPSGATAPTASGLAAGAHTVTITDYKGCVASNTVLVTEPTDFLSASVSNTNVSCHGGSDGAATVTASGGTSPYTYAWQTSSGATITNLSAGIYQVAVVDNNGCSIVASAQINEPTPVVAGISNFEDDYCQLGLGQAHVYVSGGSGQYNFTWLPAGGNSASAMALGAGNYSINITDLQGCPANASVAINNIPAFTATVTVDNNVSCFGGANGAASVATQNGYSPFIYSWAPSGNTTANATGLVQGTHSVTVTDSKGCQFNGSVAVSQPTELTAVMAQPSHVSCNGGNNGSATINVSGGTPNYSFFWNTSPVQTTATASGLPTGNYSVTVTDNNGCVKINSVNINEPPALQASISYVKNITCNAGQDGGLGATASFGTPPYTYLWNTSPIANTSSVNNLSAGVSYVVLVADANGCSQTLSQTLTEPPPVITVASPDQAICRGQNVTVSATGGVSYFWDNGLGMGQSHTPNPPPSVPTTYTVIAFGPNSCPGNPASTFVDVYYFDLSNLVVDGTPLICPGMSGLVYATLVNSSSGPVSYSWNNGLPTTSVPTAHVVTPSNPITYTVTVTNQQCGFQANKSFSIGFRLPPVISLLTSPLKGCEPHTVTLNDVAVNSDDPVLSWNWDFGDGNASMQKEPTHIYANAGQYTITLNVATVGGCTNSSAGSPTTAVVYPKPKADFTYNPDKVFIHELVTFLNNSEGARLYYWDFGDGTRSAEVNPRKTYSTAGTYSITLTSVSEFGCRDEVTKEILATGNILVPNVFTPSQSGPNGGGYNKSSMENTVFFPFTDGVVDFHMMIFNRWGELIFESKDINVGWDGYYRGKLCQQDAYVWKISARFNDNRVFNSVGDVTLLR
jgi:large repetitive protein